MLHGLFNKSIPGLQHPHGAPQRITIRITTPAKQLQWVAPSVGRASSLRVFAAAASEQASTVRIIIQGRKLEVTPAIKTHIEQKLSHAVASFENVVKEIDVKVKVHGGDATKGPKDQMTEVTVYTFRNGVVRCTERAENLYASIDMVADKLARNMRKLKEKALPKGKWPGHKATVKGGKVITEVIAATDVIDKLPLDKTPQLPEEVLRTKYFMLDPMDAQDAVDQLDLLGHSFFIFQDSKSNTVQVVYRRKEGGYGLIVPQLKEHTNGNGA